MRKPVNVEVGTCKLCERGNMALTGHHLVPRARHNKRVKRELGDERHKQAGMCRPCHSQLHSLFTEKELEQEYNTLEKLKAHPDVQKWIKWVRGKPFGQVIYQ